MGARSAGLHKPTCMRAKSSTESRLEFRPPPPLLPLPLSAPEFNGFPMSSLSRFAAILGSRGQGFG